MAEEENGISLYATDDGKSQISLMSRDGRIWLNQKQDKILHAFLHCLRPADRV